MKLVFKKDEDSHINVFQKIDDVEKEFSYEEMIASLIEGENLEVEIMSLFSDAEVKSINSMVEHINLKIPDVGQDESDNEDEGEDNEGDRKVA